MFSKVVLALALCASATATLYSPVEESQKYMWESFKTEYGRAYGAEEEATRFAIFVANLKVIDERNAADTATHGITKFADLSPQEFKQRVTNYIPQPEARAHRAYDASVKPLPEGAEALVDWTGTYTTPVKDQGYCGSCWAFSATEQVESDYMRLQGKTQILSAQQVTSCTKYVFGGGCNGGFTENAFEYMEGGVETESDYPYTSGNAGITGSCSASVAKFVVKATGYTTVSDKASDESKMASYMQSTGPLSVCVDAETWSSYTGGILSKCGSSVDHCVQAVGVDTAAGYWKVRNSWGTSWGESGFIRLAYGENTCAIASDANYASAADV